MDAALLAERCCHVCGQADDHPRDFGQLSDGTSSPHHIDCGAIDGCVGCRGRIEAVGHAKGAELRARLIGQAG